jgi:hypothetical protein
MSLGSSWQRSALDGNRRQHGGHGHDHHHRHHGHYGNSVQVWVPGPFVGVGAVPNYLYPSHASYVVSHGAPTYWFQYGGSSTSFSYSSGPVFAPLTSVYSPLQPGMAPAPLGFSDVAPLPAEIAPPPEAVRPATDLKSIVDEFAPADIVTKEINAADRVDSLRFQARGDEAVRRGDLTSAFVFYQTAANRDPLRQGPWLRMTWVHIGREEFAESVACLKRALLADSAVGASWITAGELAGVERTALRSPENAELWRWLAEKPASTDRLLLTAAYLYFHNRPGSAEEVLAMARPYGLPEEHELALKRTAGQVVDGVGDSKPVVEEEAANELEGSAEYRLVIPEP